MVRANFDIDHFQPVALRSDLFLAYDNLVYSCATCNAAKGARLLPNPETTLVRDCIQVEEDGRLVCRTPEARRLVRMLGLNDVEFVEFRMLWLGIVALAKEHDPALWRRLMGYPIDLPDLEALRPPGGNVRPEGVRESSFALKLRGELPEVY